MNGKLHKNIKYTEVNEFIKLMKRLDEKQQIGLNITIQGLAIIAEKQKSGQSR